MAYGLLSCFGLDRPVPACPDWVLRDLLLHLGEVQRFWAENVSASDITKHWNGERTVPSSDEHIEEWFRHGSAQLVDALDQVPADAPCWTWWEEPQTASAVARHQVQEAAVHRWDVESCVGTARPIDAAAADDGVSEFLSIMLGGGAGALEQSIGLVSTDTNSIWLAGPPDAPQAATVTATASDLVLLLYGRAPLSVADVAGDQNPMVPIRLRTLVGIARQMSTAGSSG